MNHPYYIHSIYISIIIILEITLGEHPARWAAIWMSAPPPGRAERGVCNKLNDDKNESHFPLEMEMNWMNGCTGWWDGGVGGSDTDRRMAPYKPFKCLFVHLLCVYVTCVCLVWSVGRSHLYIRSPCVHSVRECEYFHSCIFDNANGKFFTFSTFAAAAKRWRLRSTHTMDILQIVPIARLAQSPSPHIVELSM